MLVYQQDCFWNIFSKGIYPSVLNCLSSYCAHLNPLSTISCHGNLFYTLFTLLDIHPFFGLMMFLIMSIHSLIGVLTHCGRVTHICVSKRTIISSDNGLSPGRHSAIIWTNVEILLILTLGTNLSEMLSEIHTLPFKKMRLKMSSAKWQQFCLSLIVLMDFMNKL